MLFYHFVLLLTRNVQGPVTRFFHRFDLDHLGVRYVLLATLLETLLGTSLRESFSPHSLHSKTVCPSLRQSALRPRRSSFSPHRHSSKMLFEKGIKCSGSTSETGCIRHLLPCNPHRVALTVIIAMSSKHQQGPWSGLHGLR